MRRSMNRMAVLFVLLVFATGASSAVAQSSINLTVSGAEPNTGNVLASLFNSSTTYMVEPLADITAAVDTNGIAYIDFGSQEPGEYAIVVIYDENRNGELDTGLFRIPKEKIGFSNNAKGRFGPARWADARFLLQDADVHIDIQLKRAKK